MTERRYGDPAALRQALTDQLRRLALARPGAQLAGLRRQFADDRLLARVSVAEPEAWVVKGATALLARMHVSARHTVDIGLYRRYAGLDEAELALRAAAALDLGDFFRFGLSPGRQVAEGRVTLHVADKVCVLLEVDPRALGPAQHPLPRSRGSRGSRFHRAHPDHRRRRPRARAWLRGSAPRAPDTSRAAVAGGGRLASWVRSGGARRPRAAGVASRNRDGDGAPTP